MTSYFVSGHLDISYGEFETHYVPLLTKALEGRCARFVVGDAPGTDILTQTWLKERGADCTVYHMLEAPRYNAGFPTRGGYLSDTERDTAMTLATYEDIAWVRPGREKSGTAKNVKRRKAVLSDKGPQMEIEMLDEEDPTKVIKVVQAPLRRLRNNMAFFWKFEAAYCIGVDKVGDEDPCSGYHCCNTAGGARLTRASLEKCRHLQGVPGQGTSEQHPL